MANPFVHLELNTPDLTQAKDFYAALFGWHFQDTPAAPGMIYTTFRPDTGPGGGMMSLPDANRGWLVYVGVDDVNAATERAKSLGAQVHVSPQPIPNVGRFSIISDPGGANLALFEPKTS